MRKFSVATLLTLLLAACGVNDQLTVVAPQLLDMHPVPGATDVATDTDVWARFDADIDEAWLTGSFTLTAESGSMITVTVAYDAATRTATFKPSAALEFDTVYEAALGAGLGSQAIGGALAEDISWSFSTAPASTEGDTGGDGDGGGDGEGEGSTGGDGEGEGDTGDGEGEGSTGGDGEGEGSTGGDGEGEGDGDTSGDEGTEGGEAGGTGNSGGTPYSECDGTVCVFENVTIDGPVYLKNGEHWTLTNVTINGAFEVHDGAIVVANNVVFGGKFEATFAEQIVVHNSTVLDWMELKYGSLVDLYMTDIGLHVQVIGHDGTVSAVSNEVDGTYMSVQGNTGGLTLTGNSGAGTLSCSANAPFDGGSDNAFDGGMSGQCAAL